MQPTCNGWHRMLALIIDIGSEVGQGTALTLIGLCIKRRPAKAALDTMRALAPYLCCLTDGFISPASL